MVRNYTFKARISSLAQAMKDAETLTGSQFHYLLEDYGDMIGTCDNCNHKLRWKHWIIHPSLPNGKQGIGIECFKEFADKYGLPMALFEHIMGLYKMYIRYAKEYRELRKSVKSDPSLIVDLETKTMELDILEKKITELRSVNHRLKYMKRKEEREILKTPTGKIEREEYIEKCQRLIDNDVKTGTLWKGIKDIRDKVKNYVQLVFTERQKEVIDQIYFDEQHLDALYDDFKNPRSKSVAPTAS